ncbi:MAG: bacteriohemerythrin, partial [Proteobacteria bacterium]|nr:bacteriohemerythrin [Pseudomonadota bacterium]
REIMQQKYINWDEKFSVHVEIIDSQHKKLFESINTLLQLMEKEIIIEDLEEILDDMFDYFDYHFSSEEKLIKSHPEFEHHRQRHLEFINNVKEYNNKFLAKDPEIIAEKMFVFLSEWLQNHILREDRYSFDYLQKHNLLKDEA